MRSLFDHVKVHENSVQLVEQTSGRTEFSSPQQLYILVHMFFSFLSFLSVHESWIDQTKSNSTRPNQNQPYQNKLNQIKPNLTRPKQIQSNQRLKLRYFINIFVH